MIVTRFAPSPTGPLHLGHAYSALFAFEAAKAAGGRFLLRIEDIDLGRCREEFVAAIFDDLAWLGLVWEKPVRRQSEHFAEYQAALERLESEGLLYPCFCTRQAIAREIAQAGQAPHGPDGPAYPGICRRLSADERRARKDAGLPYALRLDVGLALGRTGALFWHDRRLGRMAADPTPFGDVVLGRKDIPASYHLAVTLDDHLQGVTLVTRGEDLAPATHIHRLLQSLFDLDTPEYHHHPLLAGPDGKRLAKRDRAQTLASLRQAGESPTSLRGRIQSALGGIVQSTD